MALAATLLLAGCGGKSNTASIISPTAGPAEAGADTAGISGLVTSEDEAPIEQAMVGIPQLGVETVTDATGAFSFSHLQPGTYPIFAAKVGYTSTSATIQLNAGEVAPPISLQLVPLPPMNASYSRLETLRGFISCGTGTYVLTQVACGASDTQQRFLFKYNITTNMTGVIWEQVWKPTQLLSKDLVLNIEKDNCGVSCRGASTFGSAHGCCYLRIVKEASGLDIGDVKAHTAGATIQSRTFPAYSTADNLPTFYLQQSFDIYVEYSYGELPPDYGNRTNVPV